MKPIYTFFLLITVLATASFTHAQDANRYPLSMEQRDLESQLNDLDWKLKRLEMTKAQRQRKYQQYVDESHARKQRSNDLADNLPIEMRFASKQVRDSLVGECLKELLMARLDLASHEILIKELTQQLEEAKNRNQQQHHLNIEKNQLAVRAAEMKMDLAASELDMSRKLHEKGSVTSREMQRAEYQFELAKLELSNAKVDFEMSARVDTSDLAQRLVDARIHIQPLKARFKAAEDYLKQIASSGDQLREIEELQMLGRMEQENAQEFQRDIWEVEKEIEEIVTLKRLAQARMKELENRSRDQSGDDQREKD